MCFKDKALSVVCDANLTVSSLCELRALCLKIVSDEATASDPRLRIANAIQRLHDCKQEADESPLAFDARCTALEEDIPPMPPSERKAWEFFIRLQPYLQYEILMGRETFKNKNDVCRLAQWYYELKKWRDKENNRSRGRWRGTGRSHSSCTPRTVA